MTEDMPSDYDRAMRSLARNVWGTLESIDANLKRIADMLEANQKGEANFNVETGLEKINYARLRDAIHYKDSRP